MSFRTLYKFYLEEYDMVILGLYRFGRQFVDKASIFPMHVRFFPPVPRPRINIQQSPYVYTAPEDDAMVCAAMPVCYP